MKGEWFKKAGASAAAYLLALVLFTISSTAVFYFVLAQPEKIKDILSNSGAYGSFTEAFADEVAKNPGDDTTLPLDDPAIQKAAKKAFSPQTLKTNTEKFVEGTYDWLDGTTEEPRFTLDFTDSKNSFAAETGKYAQRRAAQLPPCSFQNIPTTVDPFKIECLPPGVTPAQIGAKTTQDIRADNNFLPDPKITPANIFPNAEENPFKTSNLPEQFSLMKNLFWIFIILAAALTGATIYLSADRLKGVRKAAKSFLAVGVFVTITPLLLGFFSSRMEGSGLFNDAISQEVGLPIFNEFIGTISSVYYIFGVLCILIGGAGLIAAYRLKPASPNSGDNSSAESTG